MAKPKNLLEQLKLSQSPPPKEPSSEPPAKAQTGSEESNGKEVATTTLSEESQEAEAVPERELYPPCPICAPRFGGKGIPMGTPTVGETLHDLVFRCDQCNYSFRVDKQLRLRLVPNYQICEEPKCRKIRVVYASRKVGTTRLQFLRCCACKALSKRVTSLEE